MNRKARSNVVRLKNLQNTTRAHTKSKPIALPIQKFYNIQDHEKSIARLLWDTIFLNLSFSSKQGSRFKKKKKKSKSNQI